MNELEEEEHEGHRGDGEGEGAQSDHDARAHLAPAPHVVRDATDLVAHLVADFVRRVESHHVAHTIVKTLRWRLTSARLINERPKLRIIKMTPSAISAEISVLEDSPNWVAIHAAIDVPG